MINSYTVIKNGDIIEVEWYVRNVTTNVDATGVVSTFELPVDGLSYLSHVVAATNGVYNPLLATWTVGTVHRGTVKKIKIKYTIDDISFLNMTIKQTITLNESDSVLDNNIRRIFISKTGTPVCDPDNFITPTLEVSDSTLYELLYIGGGDTITCPCCTKTYEIVANSSVNVVVTAISQDGYAKITRINPMIDGSFQYTAACSDCTDGEDYTSAATATVTVKKLFSGNVKEYEAILTLKSDGSAPTVYVVNTEFTGTIVWTRTATGAYLATLAGAFIWFNTTTYSMPQYNTTFRFDGSRLTDNTVGYTHSVSGVVADPVSDVTVNVLIKVKTPYPALSPSVTPSVTTTPTVTPSITITPTITPTITTSTSVTPTITTSTSVTPSITVSITPLIQ